MLKAGEIVLISPVFSLKYLQNTPIIQKFALTI